MIKLLLTRLRQGHRTTRYPAEEPSLPDRFRGRPILDETKCRPDCAACVESCPTNAITARDDRLGKPLLALDLGRCLYCADCTAACPAGAVTFSRDFRMASNSREELVVEGDTPLRAKALDEKLRRLFGRSLKLRQVSAGGCNACEADVNVLGTVVFDLGRFGIQFVASPRHADGLLITGPVTRNMQLALKKTYDAVPSPKIVIAVGACAISGGPYVDHPEVCNGANAVVPVDLYVPGCPPHPFTILDGLLRLIGRIEDDPDRASAWSAREAGR